MYKSHFKTINVGGIATAALNRKELAHLIETICIDRAKSDSYEPFIIFSNNGHAVSIYNSDISAKSQMDKADLIHADGQSIVSFSKIFCKDIIPERTATTDMIHDIPNFCDSNFKHYFLGGKEETISKASSIMNEKYKNFNVVGFNNGYFSQEEEEAICNKINSLQPDILWVGLGKPKEQIFCIRNKDKLKVPIIISCGGCFNFITGEYARAPEWMQNAGLEWFHRLIKHPRKLFWRYLITNPHALWCMFTKR